jgi:hypothetical protein
MQVPISRNTQHHIPETIIAISTTIQTSNLKNITSQAIQLFNHYVTVITVTTRIAKLDAQMTLHKHTKTHSSLGVVNASGSTQRLGYHSNANFLALICFTVRFIATEPQTANE